MKHYDAEKIYWLKNHIPKNREEFLEISSHANSMPVNFPRLVYLEVGAECNLNCIFCSKPSRRKLDREMSQEVLFRVVDECAANGVYGLYLHFFNEPLLHMDKLVPVIKRAKERGIPIVAVTTNITPINEKVIHQLIDARLDTLHFSYEGANTALYEKERGVKASFVEKRIELAIRIRKEVGIRNQKGQLIPWMAITLVRTTETDEEISAFLKKWGSVVDDIEIRPVLGFLGRTKIKMGVKPIHRIPCRYLGERLVVTADGTVTGCSVDVDAQLNFGNVIDGDTIKKIWNSEKYRHLWALHQWQHWEELPEPCKSCDSWDFTAVERSQHLKPGMR